MWRWRSVSGVVGAAVSGCLGLTWALGVDRWHVEPFGLPTRLKQPGRYLRMRYYQSDVGMRLGLDTARKRVP